MAASGLNIIEVDDEDIERLIKEEAAAARNQRRVFLHDCLTPNPSNPPQRTSLIPGAENRMENNYLVKQEMEDMEQATGAENRTENNYLVKQEMEDMEQATGLHDETAAENSNLMEKVVMDFLLTTGGTPGSSSVKEGVRAAAQKIFIIKRKSQVTILPFKGSSLSTRPPIAKTSKVTPSPTAGTTPQVTAPVRPPRTIAPAPAVGTGQLTPPCIQTPQVTMLPPMLTSHSIMPLLQVCKLTTPIAKTSQVITTTTTPTTAAAAAPQIPTLTRTPHMAVIGTGQLAPVVISMRPVMMPPVQFMTPFMSTPLVATPVTIGAQHAVQGTNPMVTAPRVILPTVATPPLTIPVIARPRVETTTVATPQLTLPVITRPQVETTIATPPLTIPVITKPRVEATTVATPQSTIPIITRPRVETTTTVAMPPLTIPVITKPQVGTTTITVATPPLTIPVIAKPRVKTTTTVATTEVTMTPVKEYRLRRRKSPETEMMRYIKIRPSMNHTEEPCCRPGDGSSGDTTRVVVLNEAEQRALPSVLPKTPVSTTGNGTASTDRTRGPVLGAGKVNAPSIASFVTENLPRVRVDLDKVALVKRVPVEAVAVTRPAGPRKTGRIPEFVPVNPRPPAARPFQCPHCVKNFTTELRLRGHLRDHQDVNADSAQNKVRASSAEIHPCPHCVKKYSSELKLQAHMRIHKGTLKIHQCTFCPARYTQSSDLRVHVRKHTKERPYRCSDCNLAFSRLTYLNKHLEEHTEDVTFTCLLCVKSFPTTKGLKNHEKEHAELCRHQCPECGKPYKTQFAMKYHLLTHSKVKLPKCPVCYRLFSEESKLATHILVHVGEDEFTCPVCDKKFTRAYQKRKHMRIHGVKRHREKGLKSDSCENSEASPQRERQETVRKRTWLHKSLTCGKGFQTERRLDWHSLIHSAEKSFQCSVCSKAFSQKCSLKEGEMPFCPDCDESPLGSRQTRTPKVDGERPRSSHCTDCGGWFLSKKIVEAHRRTAETPLSCVTCDGEFSSPCDLRVHRKSHVVELRNRRWDCSVCGVTCKNRSQLKKHKVKHSSEKPYRCPVCGKGFARNSDMQKHKFIHSNEKPYHCSVCRKGFNSSSNFRLHERRHKGEKPYRCPCCSDGFYVKQGLSRHMERHHPDQEPGGSYTQV